jgi:hypothetical protein
MRRPEMKFVAVVFATLLICGLALGDDKKGKEKTDDKERVYKSYTYDQVWTSAVQAAAENFTVAHSDKESGVFEFHTGISMASNGFRCGVTVSKTNEDEIKVKLNTQKKAQLFAWGAGGRIAEKFFKALDKKLKETAIK